MGLVALGCAGGLGRALFVAWNHGSLSKLTLLPVTYAFVAGAPLDAVVAVALGWPLFGLALWPKQPRVVLGSWVGTATALLLGLALCDAAFFGYFGSRFDPRVWDFLTDRENVELVLAGLSTELSALPFALAGLAALALGMGAGVLVTKARLRARPVVASALALIGLAAVGLPQALAEEPPYAHADSFANASFDNSVLAFTRTYQARRRMEQRVALEGGLFSLEVVRAAGELLDGARLSADGTGLERHTSEEPVTWLRRPPRHIVLVVMESFAAWPLEEHELGFARAVAPEFLALAQEGIWFKRHFPTSGGTLRNLHELLVGDARPMAALNLVVPGVDDAAAQVALPRWMKRLGYRPVFHYGGDYEWLELRERLVRLGFETLAAGRDAPQRAAASLGIPDDELFAQVVRDVSSAQGPSFDVVLTTTNHPPYEVPASYRPRAFYLPPRYRSRVDNPQQAHQRFVAYQYADAALGRLIRALRATPSFDDTLFVIVGDHAFPSTLRPDPERALIERRVPLVLYGPDLLTQSGVVIEHFTSQRDLLPTLVGALAPGATVRTWGRSLFEAGEDVLLSPDLACWAGHCLMGHRGYRINDDLTLTPDGVDTPAPLRRVARALTAAPDGRR